MLIPLSFYSAFGDPAKALSALLIALVEVDEIELRYGKFPCELDADEVREFFGVVVH